MINTLTTCWHLWNILFAPSIEWWLLTCRPKTFIPASFVGELPLLLFTQCQENFSTYQNHVITHFQLLHTFINSGYCVSEHAYLSFMLFSICMLLRGFACLDMHIKSLFVLWRKLCSDTQKNGRCFCQSMTVLFRCTINLVKSIYFICNFLYSLYFLTRLFFESFVISICIHRYFIYKF